MCISGCASDHTTIHLLHYINGESDMDAGLIHRSGVPLSRSRRRVRGRVFAAVKRARECSEQLYCVSLRVCERARVQVQHKSSAAAAAAAAASHPF